MYDKLVEEVNNIDTNGSVLKTKYDRYRSNNLENKISDAFKKISTISGRVKQIIMLKLQKSKEKYLVLVV